MVFNTKLILGIVLVILSIIGVFLDIKSNWHYFGTGVFFGFGISLIFKYFQKEKAGH